MFELVKAKIKVKILPKIIYLLSRLSSLILHIESTAMRSNLHAKDVIFQHKWTSTMTTLNVANGGTGYTSPTHYYSAGINFSSSFQNSGITFNSQGSNEILRITPEGDVKWSGTPSQAAEVFRQCLQFHVEDQVKFKAAARSRYYMLACKNILNKAETMQHDELLDFLKDQVYNRERKVIIDSLKGKE